VSLLTLVLFSNKTALICSVLFSLLHELGHIAVSALFKIQINEISFLPFGISLKCQNLDILTPFKRIAVYLGGVTVNLILFLLVSFKEINLAIIIFNLLPIGWLDGGRISFEILTFILGKTKGDIIHSVLSFVLLVPLSALSVYFLKQNPTLLIVCGYLFITVVLKKKRMLK
jgi:Zn-dependent protease